MTHPDAPPADLMLIVPHPDDEVFSTGGILSKMSEAGLHTVTATLTRGGSGRTLGLCTQAELPDLRERELRASLRVLGVQDVYIFDYPDFVPDAERGLPQNGGLRDVPEEEGIARIAELLGRHRPKALVTFPPNGSNGHPDHVTTNDWVLAALEGFSEQPSLYYFAGDRPYVSETPRDGFLAADAVKELFLPPTHYFEVGHYLENKLRAMAQHETQARSVLAYMRANPRRLMLESFHRARPSYPNSEGARTVQWLR
jgi:LmbE family N-acetylglucosaminyl deacetylase